MPQHRDIQKQLCLGALGASAMVGLPHLFVQPSGGVVPRANPAATTGSATRIPDGQRQSTGIMGALPMAGLGVASAALMASKAARSSRSTNTVPVRAFENELGVQQPVGFFDPLGYTNDGDEATFKRRRSVELKHGRISMLATMGYITPEITGKFPGYLSPSQGLAYDDIPNGLGAISKVPAAGWAQMVAYCLFVEVKGGEEYLSGAPGDFGFKVLTASDEAAKQKKLSAELANGRLAMMAIIGMFFQDGLTGSAWGDWSLYTDSPLRAFEEELGVQSPFGFWDPAGFTLDGDADAFKRRRVTELKHGRVSMLATLGFMVPEGYRFDGYLSPSEGLKFSDMPHGLAAISKVPGLGWLQIAVFIGWLELGFYRYDAARAPGDYEKAGVLGFPDGSTISDPEEKKRRLNSEIANGRLAMTAILALLFQNGTVGTTGPEMWLGKP